MKKYTIEYDDRLSKDIQKPIDFYKSKQKGLQHIFYTDFKNAIKAIQLNPFYQIRYDTIRCIPLSKFPYLIHFSVNESLATIQVHALTCDYNDPELSYPGKK